MATPWAKMTLEQKARAHAAQKRYWSRNRERLASKKNKHYHKFRDKYLAIERERSYQKLYGIGIADYDRMFIEQGGRCGICNSDKSLKGGKIQFFSVDHCHDTQRIRGLLCLACNQLLGRYERHREKIEAYLKRGVQ